MHHYAFHVSDAEFDASLGEAIGEIFTASTEKTAA